MAMVMSIITYNVFHHRDSAPLYSERQDKYIVTMIDYRLIKSPTRPTRRAHIRVTGERA
jgi:hypothetical protein